MSKTLPRASSESYHPNGKLASLVNGTLCEMPSASTAGALPVTLARAATIASKASAAISATLMRTERIVIDLRWLVNKADGARPRRRPSNYLERPTGR